MEKIIDNLKILGFSENEAKVYLHLLKNPGDNGTQISKVLTISRSAIYSALESLEKKKIINLLPSDEDRKNYEVFKPNIFLMDKKNEFEMVLRYLENELSSMYEKYNKEQIHFITNQENYKYLVIDMLKNAKKEILISGSLDEFLTQNILSCKNEEVNLKVKEKNDNTLIILVDNQKVLIKDKENIIYTKNLSLVNIIRDKIEMENR